ncbi:MAG TPA: 3-hydroxyacyl-CoA dehydrogenase family protein, partial [Solirubrobacterales bacterium]|nr:3-hydroxyacyl-CoA dehydrogenase family protein [Solirubrobacterales bacterium]
ANAGIPVSVIETAEDALKRGLSVMEKNYKTSVSRGALREEDVAKRMGLLNGTTDIAATKDADLVIEAVFEDLEVKRTLWSSLDEVAPERAIFASNTSSISIDALAEAVSPGRRGRFVGMHFFSPVPVMPLIELIRGRATTAETEAAVREVTEALGKKLIVSADRPGFIVNRILMPMLAEAMRILEEGSATADDIDTGAKVGLNHPMGPLELADFIGLDVCLNVMQVLNEGIGEEHYPAPRILVDLVAAGHLGQKTGRGFHAYPRD